MSYTGYDSRKMDYTESPDPVKSPPHYMDGGIETIDYIEAKLSPEEFVGYCKGNVLKYVSRAGKKFGADTWEDLRKAAFYLERLDKKKSPHPHGTRASEQDCGGP